MKLAVSQIAWPLAEDDRIHQLLCQQHITGLEIAPSRFVDHKEPYAQLATAEALANALRARYGLTLPSMQSIWFGRTEQLFGSAAEYALLLDYTRQAIRFAAAIHCPHLVFGCPKNRVARSPESYETAIAFFRDIGAYAAQYAVTIGIEANPAIYGTNFLYTLNEVAQFVRETTQDAVRINLDIGAMVENDETEDDLIPLLPLISHVHLSEPYLVAIKERPLHCRIAALLREVDYMGYVSLEMRTGDEGSTSELMQSITYLTRVFGDE